MSARGFDVGTVWLAEWGQDPPHWIAFFVADVRGDSVEARCFAAEGAGHEDCIRFRFKTSGHNDPFIEVCRRIG